MLIILIPAIPNPVKNLITANMAKLYEKALANPKKVVATYDNSSILLLPNLLDKVIIIKTQE